MITIRRSGDKSWAPVNNLFEFHDAFVKSKEGWNEFRENRRLYFAVYRRERPRLKNGRKERYPPIPVELHYITARYLEDR